MNPTLNSPKYADPKSLAFQMYKKQQDRKQRKGYPYDPQLEQRYFRRNEGSTDYATIPEVTLSGDFVIEVLALFTGTTMVMFGNTANFFTTARINTDGSIRWRPVGNSAEVLSPVGVVNANELTLLSFSRAGSIAEIKVNGISAVIGGTSTEAISFGALFNSGGSLSSGILANLKIYDNGTLVRDYPLNDNSDTIRDKANGQDGTIINGNADDWGLFDKQANGDWLGQELVVNGGFDSDSGWTLGAGWSISDGLASHVSSSTSNLNQSANPLRESSVYLSSFSVTDVTPSVDGVRIRIGSGGNGVLREEEGTYSEIITATNNELLFTANAFFTGSIDNVSVKEVLKNA